MTIFDSKLLDLRLFVFIPVILAIPMKLCSLQGRHFLGVSQQREDGVPLG